MKSLKCIVLTAVGLLSVKSMIAQSFKDHVDLPKPYATPSS